MIRPGDAGGDELTPLEVEGLTGAKSASRQAAILARKGIPFRFGGGVVSVKRAVAAELPHWRARLHDAGPRMNLIR